MIACAKTDIGIVRRMNQDSVSASVEPVGKLSCLYMVADGMGGHKAGDFASRFVIEHMNEHIASMEENETVPILRQAVIATNRELFRKSKSNPDLEGTGSTLVAATIAENTLYVANVGDSRLYLLRDELKQITRDHSLVEEMVSLGQIRRDSVEYRNQKNIITRAMGTSPEVEADIFGIPLEECDCILLCSDGLTNMVSDEEISRILKTTDTIEEKTRKLIDTANENGGRDNISVILVEPQISEVDVCR